MSGTCIEWGSGLCWSCSLSFSQAEATVIKEVMAVADYTAQYEDELTFRAGDKIKITLESESDARSQPPPPVLMRTPRIIVTLMQ